jgi:hypothetical protein
MDGNTPTLMQSEEERAPWNEAPAYPLDYEVVITETITRRFHVSAYDEEQAKASIEEECFGLDDLIIELKDFVKNKLEVYKGYSKEEIYLNRILKSIEDYEITEKEVTCS